MAKKYTSNKKVPEMRQAQVSKTAPDAEYALYDEHPSPLRGWFGLFSVIAFIFILTLAGSMDNTIEKWMGWLTAIVTVLLLLTSKQFVKLKDSMTPLFFSVIAYIIWGGISTFYAASGKFAIYEFSKLLVMLCVYLAVLFLAGRDESGFKRIAYALASAGCFWGIVSVDAASSGYISYLFKKFISLFTDAYAQNGAFEQGIRITSITGNPNTYAGFMAIAVLFSLYLVIKATDKRSSRISLSLLAVNSLSYLLAFSMGSLFMFLVACLVMIGISDKGERITMFIIMLETAVLAFIFAFLSMIGLGKTGSVAFVPIIALALNAFFLYQTDMRLRPVLSKRLNANIKLLLTSVIAIIVVISVYMLAAFQISNEMKLSPNESFMRAIYVPGGEYTLEIESSEPISIRVESQNNYDLMRRTSSTLYRGATDQAINFTVPEDSAIVRISFSALDSNAVVSDAIYSGTESGSVHLNYPLLPNIIANRIQNLFANENAVQRTMFFEDGIKLFLKSPVIGRGLGGFENGTYSVQEFYYETKYAHNHYIQVLSDLGIIGFLLFLSTLLFSVISIVGAKKDRRSFFAVPVLAACTFQMYGQALTDATWSTGIFLGYAAAIIALITIFCSKPARYNDKVSASIVKKIEKFVLAGFAVIFFILLSGNLYAHAQAEKGVKSFADIERLIMLDRFEYNDYKLSYIINAPKSGDKNIMAQADLYANELSKVESNSLAPYLVAYNFETYKDYDAFEAAKAGIRNAGSYPGMWTRLFDIFEEHIDPVGPYSDDAVDRLKSPRYYVDSALELYDALLERNRNSLDWLTLSPYNNAFIGKLLEIRATNLYTIDWTFTALMTYAFDSECAADANQDGVPDSITALSGSISQNEDKLLTVTDNTVLELNLYQKLGGTYTFKVRTDKPQGVQIAMDGVAQEVKYGDREAYITIDLPDNSEMKLTKFNVTFPSAAVIDYITYTTKLEE